MLHDIAFAELDSYIETYRGSLESRPINGRYEEPIHNQAKWAWFGLRLNDRILAAIPDLRLQTEGSDILLIYDEDIVTAVKQACTDDCDSDALILAKASNIIRRDVFEPAQSFNGRFPVDWHEKAVPQSLAALVIMLLTGPNIKDQCAEHKPLSQNYITIDCI